MSTTDELERELRDVLRHQAASVTERETSAPVVTVPGGRRRRSRAARILALVAAIMTAIVVAVGIAVIRRDGGQNVSANATPPAVAWETKHVSLTAADFSITVDGKEFTADGAAVQVHSDPGDDEYTTLELEWQEHGVEMRWYIYLTSNGTEWWANEMATYGASSGDSSGEEWITFNGEFFRSKLGTPYTGDVDLSATELGSTSTLRLSGMVLEAFRRPAACTTPTSDYVLDPGYDPVDFTGAVSARLLETATCTPVADLASFEFEYTSADPAVATVTPDPIEDADCPTCALRASVRLEGPGQTTVTMTARDKETGTVVATGQFEVRVSDAGWQRELDHREAEQCLVSGEGKALYDAVVAYRQRHGAETTPTEADVVADGLLPAPSTNYDLQYDGLALSAVGVGTCTGAAYRDPES